MSSLKMTKYFLDRGHRSFCLCKKESELHRNLRRNRLPHFSLKILSHYSPGSILRIRRLVKENDIDIVHCHFTHDLWLLAPALWKLPQVKLFATCHMLFSRIKKKDWGHRLIYRRLKKTIALTWMAREFHLKCLPLSSEDMVVIPNGVDLSRFSPEKYNRNSIRKEFMIKEGEPLVGLIGRLDQSKGQEELVYAASEVVKKFPACKFLIVGEETKGGGKGFLNKIQNLIKELHLQDNIIMTGFRTDTPEVLKALDIFVFPSYKETFGISLLEAMAMGLPIVATDLGGPPEILDYGSCALLIPPREAPPLAEAIKRYLKFPNFAQKMATNARKRVEEYYDINLVLSKIEKLYSDSLGDRPA